MRHEPKAGRLSSVQSLGLLKGSFQAHSVALPSTWAFVWFLWGAMTLIPTARLCHPLGAFLLPPFFIPCKILLGIQKTFSIMAVGGNEKEGFLILQRSVLEIELKLQSGEAAERGAWGSYKSR